MADFTIKRGDTSPSIRLQLLQEDDSPFDLNADDVCQIRMKDDQGHTGVMDPATITDLGEARIEYEWQTGDLTIAGPFNAEVEITRADGSVETVPNDGYFTILVFEDLG